MQVEREPVHDGAEPALQPLGPLEADVAERSNVVAPDRDRVLRHGDSLPGRRRPADVERLCSDAPRRPRAARSDRRPLGDRVCCHGLRSAHGLASPLRLVRSVRAGGPRAGACPWPRRALSSRSSSAAEATWIRVASARTRRVGRVCREVPAGAGRRRTCAARREWLRQPGHRARRPPDRQGFRRARDVRFSVRRCEFVCGRRPTRGGDGPRPPRRETHRDRT